MSRRKLSAPQGQWNRCTSFEDCQTNACCMGPEKPADVISKVLNSKNFRRLRSLCIDILACHNETIRAITVIRLNLNPLFKNPRSANADIHMVTAVLWQMDMNVNS